MCRTEVDKFGVTNSNTESKNERLLMFLALPAVYAAAPLRSARDNAVAAQRFDIITSIVSILAATDFAEFVNFFLEAVLTFAKFYGKIAQRKERCRK